MATAKRLEDLEIWQIAIEQELNNGKFILK